MTGEQRYTPPRPPDEAQKSLLKSMQAEVARRGRELGIAPEAIASKRDLSAVIIGGARDSRLLTTYRSPFVGSTISVSASRAPSGY